MPTGSDARHPLKGGQKTYFATSNVTKSTDKRLPQKRSPPSSIQTRALPALRRSPRQPRLP